jgi:hypothetical protein
MVYFLTPLYSAGAIIVKEIKLIETNFNLPLGSLGISPETNNIYYRLVTPLAFETTITAAYLADVYDMVMYPMEAYYKEFAEYVNA